jgi:hypothetical protein
VPIDNSFDFPSAPTDHTGGPWAKAGAPGTTPRRDSPNSSPSRGISPNHGEKRRIPPYLTRPPYSTRSPYLTPMPIRHYWTIGKPISCTHQAVFQRFCWIDRVGGFRRSELILLNSPTQSDVAFVLVREIFSGSIKMFSLTKREILRLAHRGVGFAGYFATPIPDGRRYWTLSVIDTMEGWRY